MSDLTKEPNPVGRPSSYKSTYVDDVFKLSLLGATDKEVADFFSVCEATINTWKIQHPEFLESMCDGKLKADTQVAHKLYDKALGAEWIEQQAFKVRNQEKTGSFTEEIQIVDVKRVAPPDTQAISLWLRNRQGAKWRDKIDHEHTGKDGEAIEIKDVTAIEFARRAAFLFAQASKELENGNQRTDDGLQGQEEASKAD